MSRPQGINARFWEYVNGSLVKITMRPDQTMNWGERHSTDEGWHGTSKSWEYDGLTVYHTYVSEGRDCDGELSETLSFECALELLQSETWYDGETPKPRWEKLGHRVYDQYAQMMNY